MTENERPLVVGKRLARGIMALAFFAMAAVFPGPAFSSVLTFQFDPNDLLGLYPGSAGSDTPGGRKIDQPNARRLHQAWASTWFETFYNPPAPHTQPNDYNTYRNWLGGLGPGEGISAFNIWLLDNPAARSWGEKTVWNPAGPMPTGTADAAGNWYVSVDPNPWGPGFLVEWWTDNPAYYLRPGGADIGEFSFSGVAYHDNNSNGYDASDPEVAEGDTVRIWFGSYTDASIHFDASGWGTDSPSYSAFPATGTSGWEGTLNIVAAVPEPATALLLGLGLAGLGIWGRKRIAK